MLGPAWRVERGFAAPFCSFVFCCQVVSSSFQFSDLFDRRWHLKPKMVQILGRRAEISWAYLTAALWSTSIRMLLVLRWEEMSHGAWSCSLLFDTCIFVTWNCGSRSGCSWPGPPGVAGTSRPDLWFSTCTKESRVPTKNYSFSIYWCVC